MRDRGDYYKQYAARRREIDRQRRSTPEGKAKQLQIRLERIEAEKRATLNTEWDIFVREEANLLCNERMRDTGIPWESDHMLPLRAKIVSGLNCGDNIQVIPAKLNRSKKNNMIYTNRLEWVKDLETVCRKS
ncbi:endonuclease VII [Salmonella phage SPLA5a]|nr:endonuclease VII [Salmonella phage SPLA5a]